MHGGIVSLLASHTCPLLSSIFVHHPHVFMVQVYHFNFYSCFYAFCNLFDKSNICPDFNSCILILLGNIKAKS